MVQAEKGFEVAMDEKPAQSILEKMAEMGHEQLVFSSDAASGYRGLIAIHSTRLGPAVGGTRFWNYASEEEAIIDALRLSRRRTCTSSCRSTDSSSSSARCGPSIFGHTRTGRSTPNTPGSLVSSRREAESAFSRSSLAPADEDSRTLFPGRSWTRDELWRQRHARPRSVWRPRRPHQTARRQAATARSPMFDPTASSRHRRLDSRAQGEKRIARKDARSC